MADIIKTVGAFLWVALAVYVWVRFRIMEKKFNEALDDCNRAKEWLYK